MTHYLTTPDDRDHAANRADTEVLRAAARSAAGGLSNLRRAKDIERRDRLAALTKQLDEELAARFDAEIDAALAAEKVADRAYQQEMIRAGRARLAAIDDPRREEWGYTGQTWERNRPYKQTGRTGFLEVRDFDSKFPENVRDYAQPVHGEVFVRINRKDGSPGLQFVKSYREQHWKPIGWTPEVAP